MYTVYCPTDFSAGAKSAADFAVLLAKAWSAPLILIHAYEAPMADEMGISRFLADIRQLSMDSLKAEEERLEGHFVQVRFDAVYGTIDSVLASLTEENSAHSIVVMATQGANDSVEAFFGTNAVSVMQRLSCPVWVIPPHARIEKPRKIVVAVDAELKPTDAAFSTLVVAGKRLGARIEALHVHISEEEVCPSWAEKEQRIRAHGIPVEVVRNSTVEEGLMRWTAEEPHVAVAVIVRKRHWLWDLRHHSVSAGVAYHLNQPLLVLHED